MRLTYKLTNETKTIKDTISHRDVTLHRIVALPDNKFAAPGTFGGWVEREDNLLDGAWIANDACAYGDALISGNTVIEDNVQVYGDSWVHGEMASGFWENHKNICFLGEYY